jgi:hypothetical protein
MLQNLATSLGNDIAKLNDGELLVSTQEAVGMSIRTLTNVDADMRDVIRDQLHFKLRNAQAEFEALDVPSAGSVQIVDQAAVSVVAESAEAATAVDQVLAESEPPAEPPAAIPPEPPAQ